MGATAGAGPAGGAMPGGRERCAGAAGARLSDKSGGAAPADDAVEGSPIIVNIRGGAMTAAAGGAACPGWPGAAPKAGGTLR